MLCSRNHLKLYSIGELQSADGDMEQHFEHFH